MDTTSISKMATAMTDANSSFDDKRFIELAVKNAAKYHNIKLPPIVLEDIFEYCVGLLRCGSLTQLKQDVSFVSIDYRFDDDDRDAAMPGERAIRIKIIKPAEYLQFLMDTILSDDDLKDIPF